MDLTRLFAQVVGPVLVLRAVSIVLHRQQFVEMLRGLDREVSTVAFSFFPVALLMACIGLAVADVDTARPVGVLIRLIAWGGILKASALILFPDAMVAKARALERAGILNVVLAVCTVLGGYLTWVGYVAP